MRWIFLFLTDYVVKHTDYVICIVFFILISIIKLGERKEMLHMILFLSRSVVRSLIKNDAIEMEKAEVYQYGFEILFSSIITFLIAVLSGILLHCFAASMLFFIIFATFRQICGGYHAKHYWRCNLLFLGVISYEKKSSESAHCCNDERHLLFCRCGANLCSGVSFFYIAVKSAY